MPKNADQILAEAIEAPIVKMKLVYYCTNCPWWTNRLESLVRSEGSARMCCPQCATPVRTFPLDVWLGSHKEDLTYPDYEKFLACFDENWDPAKQVQDPQA